MWWRVAGAVVVPACVLYVGWWFTFAPILYGGRGPLVAASVIATPLPPDSITGVPPMTCGEAVAHLVVRNIDEPARFGAAVEPGRTTPVLQTLLPMHEAALELGRRFVLLEHGGGVVKSLVNPNSGNDAGLA